MRRRQQIIGSWLGLLPHLTGATCISAITWQMSHLLTNSNVPAQERDVYPRSLAALTDSHSARSFQKLTSNFEASMRLFSTGSWYAVILVCASFSHEEQA